MEKDTNRSPTASLHWSAGNCRRSESHEPLVAQSKREPTNPSSRFCGRALRILQRPSCGQTSAMNRFSAAAMATLFVTSAFCCHTGFAETNRNQLAQPSIVILDPPEKDFFSKQL